MKRLTDVCNWWKRTIAIIVINLPAKIFGNFFLGRPVANIFKACILYLIYLQKKALKKSWKSLFHLNPSSGFTNIRVFVIFFLRVQCWDEVENGIMLWNGFNKSIVISGKNQKIGSLKKKLVSGPFYFSW